MLHVVKVTCKWKVTSTWSNFGNSINVNQLICKNVNSVKVLNFPIVSTKKNEDFFIRKTCKN